MVRNPSIKLIKDIVQAAALGAKTYCVQAQNGAGGAWVISGKHALGAKTPLSNIDMTANRDHCEQINSETPTSLCTYTKLGHPSKPC